MILLASFAFLHFFKTEYLRFFYALSTISTLGSQSAGNPQSLENTAWRCIEVVVTRLTRKFSKKCQFCPPKIQCFCGLPQFEKPNISQFFPSVLSKSFGNDFRIDIWRVVRVVEGAALEMLCPERDLGFESLTLRHRRHKLCIACDDFFMKNHPSLTPLFLLSPKSLPTFRGPHETVTMRVCWTFLFCLLGEATPKSWKEQAVFWRELGGFWAFFLHSNP